MDKGPAEQELIEFNFPFLFHSPVAGSCWGLQLSMGMGYLLGSNKTVLCFHLSPFLNYFMNEAKNLKGKLDFPCIVLLQCPRWRTTRRPAPTSAA